MGSSSSSFDMLHEYLSLFVGITPLYLVGVRGDLVGVGYHYKFAVQIVSVLLLILSGNWFGSLGGLFGVYSVPVWVRISVTVFIVVYITNTTDLIDGIDGLVPGLCNIVLSVLSVIFLARMQYTYALLTICTLGALTPSWCCSISDNVNRDHKLLMGDASSPTLGYMIGFLIIHLCAPSQVSPELPSPYMVIAFSVVLVPLLDTIRVVLHHLRNHRNPSLSDENYFHYELLRTGTYVRMVMVMILCVSIFLIVLNVLLVMKVNATYPLSLNLVLWLILHLVVNRFIMRHHKEQELKEIGSVSTK